MTSTDSTHPRRGSEPTRGTLLLRARTGAVTGRLTWPPSSAVESDGPSTGPRRPAIPAVLLLGPDHPTRVDRAACAARLSSLSGALVLDLPCGRSARPAEAEYALGWLADHAGEIGADPQRLVVVGLSEAADAVAALACRVRDDGWPPLAQHILALPAPSTPRPVQGLARLDRTGGRSLEGLGGCTIILDPAAPSHPYAARLRTAGVGVRQHHLPVAPSAAVPTDLLVPALVIALADTWADRPDEPPGTPRSQTTPLAGPAPTTMPASNRRKDRPQCPV